MDMTRERMWQIISGLVIEVVLLRNIWNYLMPRLFNLCLISYWDAFLLSILCGIFFIGQGQTFLLIDIRKNTKK